VKSVFFDRWHPWSVLSAALLLTAACGGPGVSCTLIGAESGVTFEVDSWNATHPTAAQAKACVESVCRTVSISRPMLLFVADQVDGPRNVRVALTMWDARQHVLFRAQALVPLTKYQPNGPKCEPTAWQAVVAPTAGGTLEPRTRVPR
jgi:hypothetical protein